MRNGKGRFIRLPYWIDGASWICFSRDEGTILRSGWEHVMEEELIGADNAVVWWIRRRDFRVLGGGGRRMGIVHQAHANFRPG